MRTSFWTLMVWSSLLSASLGTCRTTLAETTVPSTLDAQGMPTEWLLCGPFPNAGCAGFNRDYLTAAGGESAVLPREGMEHESGADNGGIVKWKRWGPGSNVGIVNLWGAGSNGIVNLGEPLSTKPDVVGYAFCYIPSDDNVVATLEVGSDDGVRIWINGDLVHDNHKHRNISPGQDIVVVRLRKGLNRCLMKVDQGVGGWLFSLRVAEKTKEGQIACRILPEEGRPLVRDENGNLRQRTKLSILNPIGETTAKALVSAAGERFVTELGTIPSGRSTHLIDLPQVTHPTPATLRLITSAGDAQVQTTISPAREWEIYVIQHTHTDIGYTALQDVIFRRHVDAMRQVLDLCRKTDDYPEGAKFKWVCETSFTVQLFLESASTEEIEQFVRRVKEGRIEVAAHYLNGTDLECAEELARKVYFAHHVGDRYGFDVLTALNNDINGLSWAVPSILSRSGVKYLAMGVNHTRSIPVLDRPNGFWWEAPDGSKVLVWNADHYMLGNYMGLHEEIGNVEQRFLPYLGKLEKKGYPFRILGIKMSGRLGDNAPPDMRVCDVIREWNTKYAYPKLIMATSRQWFQRLDKEHASQIPTYRLAWPDWWADGHASSAYETSLIREAHEGLFAAERFSTLAKLVDPSFAYPANRISKALKKMMLYDEHIWGAGQSISEPDSPATRGQWKVKASFATDAHAEAKRLLREGLVALGRADAATPKEQGAASTIGAFNSLTWPRHDLLLVSNITPDLAGAIRNHELRVEDASTGHMMPYQLVERDRFFPVDSLWHHDAESRSATEHPEPPALAFMASEVPSLGYRRYVLKKDTAGPSAPHSATFSENKIANRFFEVTLDPVTGGIASIFDRELNQELVDQDSPYKLNQYIYELPVGGRDVIIPGRKRRPEIERFSPNEAAITPGVNGPLAASIVARSSTKNTPEIVQEVLLYDFEKRIDIRNTIDKTEVLDSEGAYFAFPFAVRPFTLKTEISLAIMEPGAEQLPGSASDWHCIQHWANFSNQEIGITWVTLDAPLVQFSEINTGKWQQRLELDHPAVFSWIMNNYWDTNFKASQGGRLTFRYSITSHRGPIDNARAMRFALERANPLLSAAAPTPKRSFLQIDNPQVLLLAFKPAENADDYVLRLWNCASRPAVAKVMFPQFAILSAHGADIVERKGQTIPHDGHSLDVSLNGFDVATFVLDLGSR